MPSFRCRELLPRVVALAAAFAVLAGCAPAQGVKTDQAFDANRFTQSIPIANEWMPLKPGTRFVFEGTTIEDDGTAVPHRVVITVTDLTKVIGGVRAAITWDLDYSDGELVEAELAFFAQDSTGTVWRMGEYPEEYEEGKFVAARPWIHGFEGAKAGIMMPAKPAPGTPSYAQGWGPAVKWTDRGQVDQMGVKTCVRVSCYDDVLVIAETSESETDAQQLKYYARSVGNVRVGWRGAGEKTKETLELVSIEHLDAGALAAVRAKALALEHSAYARSKTVYAHTIVKQSQGHVIVYSEPGVGTTFKCYFPVSEVRPRVSRPMQPSFEVKGTETILLVEDEEPIRLLAATALERNGYTILAASDGDAAMALAAEHQGPIHLLLSDGVLSGVRVPELLRRFVAQRPETKILLMSGYSQEAVFQHDIVAPNTAFLPKPFTIRQLTERVREVLDSAG